jgi:hypothetical protein
VAEALTAFEAKLQALVGELDAMLPSGQEPNADQLAAIVDLCAWVHAEWVRIHPFANGNGRTARLWANSLAMRYGLPPLHSLAPKTQLRLRGGRRESHAGRLGTDRASLSPTARRFSGGTLISEIRLTHIGKPIPFLQCRLPLAEAACQP